MNVSVTQSLDWFWKVQLTLIDLDTDGAHTSSGHPPFIVVAVAPWLSHGAIVDALRPA